MPRNTMTVVLAILLGMLVLWNYTTVPETEPDSAAITTPQETTEAPLPVQAARLTPAPQQAADRARQQQELVELQQRLNEERLQQTQRTQALKNLQSQQQNMASTVGYRAQLSRRDTQIENLLDVLSSYQDAEEDLNRSASDALQNQDSAARAARDTLDYQIQQLEQNIRLTQGDLAYLQNFVGGYDVNQMQTQTDVLQSRLTDLQNQLNALRAQRVELSASIVNNARNIQSLAEQARAELRESAANTQEEIFTLRSEIERLQGAQYQTLTNQNTLRAQISNLQRDLQSNDQEIKSLEQQIINKQSQLEQ